MKFNIYTRLLILSILLLLQSSCYSVRIANKDGIPEPPPPVHDEEGFYIDKYYRVIDTVVKLNPIQYEVLFVPDCDQGSFYSLEYRMTLGNLLRNFFTFGGKKKVKIKYVCTKVQQ